MGYTYYYSLRIVADHLAGHGRSALAKKGGIPLAQMGEILLEFSKILGHSKRVCFNSIAEGSVLAIAEVSDINTKEDIDVRLDQAIKWASRESKSRSVPLQARACDRLRKMLAGDGLTATIGGSEDLSAPDFSPILDLEDLGGEEFLPIFQQGSLDGFIVRIGDSPHTPDVPVHLQSRGGDKYLCRASREVAVDMARKTPRFDRSVFRVYGWGEWSKGISGRWRVKKFQIEKYEVLLFQTGRFLDSVRRLKKTTLAKKLSQMEDTESYLTSLREES